MRQEITIGGSGDLLGDTVEQFIARHKARLAGSNYSFEYNPLEKFAAENIRQIEAIENEIKKLLQPTK